MRLKWLSQIDARFDCHHDTLSFLVATGRHQWGWRDGLDYGRLESRWQRQRVYVPRRI